VEWGKLAEHAAGPFLDCVGDVVVPVFASFGLDGDEKLAWLDAAVVVAERGKLSSDKS
jgi:hypothetical protein